MIISLPSSVTMQRASAVLAELQPSLSTATGPVVRLDASALSELDTACIAVLLQCQRQVQARGLHLKVDGVPPRLGALMALYGVAELFGLLNPNGVVAPSTTPAQG